MTDKLNSKIAPALFSAAGLLFIASGYIGEHNIAFYGAGAMFCVIGISYLPKTRRNDRS